MIKPGLKGTAKLVVSERESAKLVGSGEVDVFSTPSMIALMEQAARNAVDPLLTPENFTVGFKVEVAHLAPAPIGREVTAYAELLNVEGRKLTFKVEAFCGSVKIGEGTHIRYIVSKDKFMEKLRSLYGD